ncbi:NAD-dependent epimerase/dehydratase family protein [Fictibacillus sp. BK138]|uniref:NAD-dependent epimerase/dehydratase family protein n=1 Tax=Fictibacillus sp. BK138 TaxID=2512121 RepID=UPI001028F4D6|nr:NAD-dependent epimerase/dehydratase family protein [Fictibacillus sp. BK138]RZT15506.1 nucleoside-diphosphate-sugar epimerase [Fictibacillus sp. BK138]
MKIQIIGGTRFIGPYVVERLVRQGHEVCVFHRGETNALLPKEVKEIHGDRDYLEDYVSQFKEFQPDIVLDMFPYLKKDAESLMNVFKGIAGRVVGLSSLDIYRAYERLLNIKAGPLEPMPLKEDSPLREGLYPLQFLYDTEHRLHFYDKKLIEETILGDSDLPGTILRLPQVYGPGDRQHRLFPYLKRMMDGREKILLGDKLAKWRVSRGYVDNIAHGIVLALNEDKAKHQIYNLAEHDALTELEWVNMIKQSQGWDGEIIIVPEEEFSDSGNADQHWYMDTQKIRNELGYQEIISREEAIPLTIAWEKFNYPEKIDEKDFDYEKEDNLIKKYKLKYS